MSLFESRAEEIERVETPRVQILFYRVGRSTLVTRAAGHPELEHIERLIRRSEDLIARMGVIDVVHDWFEITGYSSEIRPRMAPWAKKTSAQHRGIHIGTASSLVRMGITMVHLFSGAPVHAYATLSELEKAMTEVLANPP
ncbi:MAG: hypothetical protein HOV80_12355 [Polyangiaceae bacterium]|nr:hypothetical protein [Polyangiaceae bacterium]